MLKRLKDFHGIWFSRIWWTSMEVTKDDLYRVPLKSAFKYIITGNW